MPFAIPMIWREQKSHHDDCYFCKLNLSGYSSKNKNKIIYPNLDSARRPVAHDETLPVPIPPENQFLLSNDSDIDEAASNSPELSEDVDYIPDLKNKDPFNQEELNDLVRDLSLSKDKAELLSSRLSEKGMLQHGVRVSYFRKRNYDMKQFFKVEGPICFCNDIIGLFGYLSQHYDPNKWRLFIDSSKKKLKSSSNPQWQYIAVNPRSSFRPIKRNIRHYGYPS